MLVDKLNDYTKCKTTHKVKRGSRHAAHTVKALRWRVDKLLKCLIKKRTLFSKWFTVCLVPPLRKCETKQNAKSLSLFCLMGIHWGHELIVSKLFRFFFTVFSQKSKTNINLQENWGKFIILQIERLYCLNLCWQLKMKCFSK